MPRKAEFDSPPLSNKPEVNQFLPVFTQTAAWQASTLWGRGGEPQSHKGKKESRKRGGTEAPNRPHSRSKNLPPVRKRKKKSIVAFRNRGDGVISIPPIIIENGTNSRPRRCASNCYSYCISSTAYCRLYIHSPHTEDKDSPLCLQKSNLQSSPNPSLFPVKVCDDVILFRPQYSMNLFVY